MDEYSLMSALDPSVKWVQVLYQTDQIWGQLLPKLRMHEAVLWHRYEMQPGKCALAELYQQQIRRIIEKAVSRIKRIVLEGAHLKADEFATVSVQAVIDTILRQEDVTPPEHAHAKPLVAKIMKSAQGILQKMSNRENLNINLGSALIALLCSNSVFGYGIAAIALITMIIYKCYSIRNNRREKIPEQEPNKEKVPRRMPNPEPQRLVPIPQPVPVPEKKPEKNPVPVRKPVLVPEENGIRNNRREKIPEQEPNKEKVPRRIPNPEPQRLVPIPQPVPVPEKKPDPQRKPVLVPAEEVGLAEVGQDMQDSLGRESFIVEEASAYSDRIENELSQFLAAQPRDIHALLFSTNTTMMIRVDNDRPESIITRSVGQQGFELIIGQDVFYASGKTEYVLLHELFAELIAAVLLPHYEQLKDDARTHRNAYIKLALLKGLLNYHNYLLSYYKVVNKYSWRGTVLPSEIARDDMATTILSSYEELNRQPEDGADPDVLVINYIHLLHRADISDDTIADLIKSTIRFNPMKNSVDELMSMPNRAHDGSDSITTPDLGIAPTVDTLMQTMALQAA
jgi:hypothetical protein